MQSPRVYFNNIGSICTDSLRHGNGLSALLLQTRAAKSSAAKSSASKTRSMESRINTDCEWAYILYNTLFSREENFAKMGFEIFSREDIFANILSTRKYLPAKISSRENNLPRKYLLAKISSRENILPRKYFPVICFRAANM